MDVLLLLSACVAGMCLPTRCLAMGVHVTVLNDIKINVTNHRQKCLLRNGIFVNLGTYCGCAEIPENDLCYLLLYVSFMKMLISTKLQIVNTTV
jgi:hypothetical protein